MAGIDLNSGARQTQYRRLLNFSAAPEYTTAERDAIIEKVNGQTIYNTTTSQLQMWNGTEWFVFGSDYSSNISDIEDDITDLQSDVSDNTSDIATNTSDIATNASNISANTSALAGKKDDDVAYYRGTLGTYTSGWQSFTTQSSDGFTLSANSRDIICQEAGRYYIEIAQLVQGSNTNYFQLRRNNVSQKQYYKSNNITTHHEVIISDILYLSVNDSIQFYITSSLSTTWGGGHSKALIYKIGI